MRTQDRAQDRRRGTLLLVGMLGGIYACTIGPASDEASDGRGHQAIGAVCATNTDCTSGVCNTLAGYCGQDNCGSDRDCPTGWTCQTSNDILSGIFGGDGTSTYCEASCSACPSGTACGPDQLCQRPEPTVTTTGLVKPNQPSTVQLVVDGHGRTIGASDVKWSLTAPNFDVQAVPSSGTGLAVNATFPSAGNWGVSLTITGGGLPEADISGFINVCSDAGTSCQSKGSCCGGECADTFCVASCGASCAPGFTCHALDETHHYTGFDFPTGQYCYPDLPIITITADPPNPHVNQEVTFTGTVTSPAGIPIKSYQWLNEYDTDLGQSPVLKYTVGGSSTFTIRLRAVDASQQFETKELQVPVSDP